jgi:hypothetical protein
MGSLGAVATAMASVVLADYLLEVKAISIQKVQAQ